ncbi:secretogranin-2b [Aplochiton taeniatus]
MLYLNLKLPMGGVVVLVSCLIQTCAVLGASLPHHHRFRGGESKDRRPAAYLPPSSDMIKALEYIENLKQRKDGGREEPTMDYDEVEKFRVLLQLATLQDEGGRDRQPSPPAQKQDIPAEQLVRALLRTLQDQAGAKPISAVPANDRRAHKHQSEDAGRPASAPREYNFPKPHKKYPLMFEDEENRDAYKRATEDLDEQYTPQSLANLRSIFEEIGRMSNINGQKRDGFGDDDDDDMFNLRNLAYEDVAGGEEWVPVEEKVETEEMVNGIHDEHERALGQTSDEEDELEGDDMQRRAIQDQEEADDDTKLVDYYLLKVLEMSDQTQKRDATGEHKKRLIRPSIVDPRTLKELLEISLKLHVPPQDLIDMLITEELRKLDRQPQASPSYRTNKSPRIRYYSRRLPVKSSSPPEDMDREDFLDIIGVETISNEYPVRQRPLKPVSSSGRLLASGPAAVSVSSPSGKITANSGRRENLFMSELNKMPLKRQAAGAVDEDDEGDDIEDEVTTYLAAKILTQYPNTISKRDTQAQMNGQFPYELYEQAMKDYFDTDKGTQAKRESVAVPEDTAAPTETQVKDEVVAETTAPQIVEDVEGNHGKPIAGM